MLKGKAITDVTVANKTDWVEVEISDTGTGILQDQMEKVFNYYYTTKEKGAGLGLPIAHRIVEAHRGQLIVDSRVGVGTKMTVRLPIGGKEIPHSKNR